MHVVIDENRNDLVINIGRFGVGGNPQEWFSKSGFGVMQEKFLVNNYEAYYSRREDLKMDTTHQYAVYRDGILVSFDFTEKYRKIDPQTGEITEVSFSQYLPEFETMVHSIQFKE